MAGFPFLQLFSLLSLLRPSIGPAQKETRLLHENRHGACAMKGHSLFRNAEDLGERLATRDMLEGVRSDMV